MNLHRSSDDERNSSPQSEYPLRLVSVRQRTALSARHWRQIGLLTIVYFLATLLSRFFVISPEILAPIWIPGGVLLAGLLWLPASAILPAIAAVFLASLAGNVLTHVALTPSLVFSFANCVGGVLGAVALRRSLGSDPRIGDLRGFVHFAVFGATLSNGVGAIVGAAFVNAFGYASFGHAWIIWFLSNAWGMLIVVPLVSEWGNIRSFFTKAVRQAWIELAVICALVSVVAFLIWSASTPGSTYAFIAPFLVFPLLVWIALRFGTAGATIGALVISALVLFTTAKGLGRFALPYESLHTRFVELQLFMAMATICALVAAVVMADRQRAEASLRYAGSIIESSNAAILGKTLDGVITSWNPGAERMYGYAAAEVIGSPVSILLPDREEDEMPDILARLQRGERIQEYETVRRRKNGELIDVSVTISPIYDKDGAIIGASSIARDITPQKRAERILEQTYERLELSFEAAQMGAWDWDFRTDKLEWFGKEEALFGFAPGSFDHHGETALARIHPEDIGRVRNEFKLWTSQKHATYEHEFRVVWPDGSEHWLFAKGRFIYQGDQAVRSIGINLDITKRKMAEKELQQTEERLARTQEISLVMLLHVSLNGEWLRVPPRFCEFLGYTHDELIGMPFKDVTHPDDFWADWSHCLRLIAGDIDSFELEKRFIRKDRSVTWGYLNCSIVKDEAGKPLHFLTYVRDINQEKHAEEALRDSEARFRSLFENAAVGIEKVGVDGRLLMVNDALCSMLGYTHQELLQTTFAAITRPEDRDREDALLQPMLRGEQDSYEIEKRYIRRDGSLLWVHITSSAVTDSIGRVLYRISIVQDISERKRAEQALRKSEGRLRVLTEALPQLVWTADASGTVEYVNRRWCAYTGQTRHQALGQGSFEVVHPDDIASVQHAWGSAIGSGTQHQAEFRLRSKDGQYRWFLARGVPLRGEDGKVERWFGTCTDIHEMKMAQQALVRSEKLASVGRMAMTIAHEINNPLAAVMNTLFLTRSEPGMPKAALNYLELADGELRRISHITRQALGFYRESTTPQVTSISELLDSVTELLTGKIRAKHINVERDFAQDVRITVVSGELRQVFSNLLSNAIDAASDGGRIQLRISKSRDAHDRRTVRITVSDNGTGISSIALPHIFEPFFTTKDTVGTGLGLWVTKQIVEKHKGCIRVRSCAEGERHGTVFSVVLPLQIEGEAVNCPATPAAMAS